MHRCGFTFFVAKGKSVINALPFLGATIGLGILIGITSLNYVGSPVSMSVLIGAEILCALIFVLGLTPQRTFSSTYELPRSVQYGIFISGLLFASSIMFLSGINISVWSDIQHSRLPNRSVAMASVATQRFLFGDRTALRLIWSLYDNAQSCDSFDSMQFYQDQAELFCMTVNGLDYSRQVLIDGTRIHKFKNSVFGVSGSGFVHQYGEIVYFNEDGVVDFANGFFGVQPVVLGEKIETVNVLEAPDGTKEYRFNGAANPQVVYSLLSNSTRANLKNGDTLFETDVSNLSTITLSDGITIHFTTTDTKPHQQLMVELPAGCCAGLEFDDTVERVRIIEHKDGSPTDMIMMDVFLNPIKDLKIARNPIPQMQSYVPSADAQLKLIKSPIVSKWVDSLFAQMLFP